ncbi:DUF5362 family protein [Paraflavisolibacter sp. H34]|uniref:DUF5362 family protein n=1 Tax=Huijunlia imazamoxiresistens TaxID=3127457 RepID=UPI0030195B3E
MEPTHSPELFSLTIDPQTKAHLVETSKWARFLAIVGLALSVLMVVAALFFMFSSTGQTPAEGEYGNTSLLQNVGAYALIPILFYALVTVFPLVFLLRFANKMRAALSGNDQRVLNESFHNLKACFRYLGIVTIIVLALYILAFVLGIFGSVATS